ncbi:hypothetical protein FB45DRAFT_1055771 [Roridomyces roridus]|uniref:Uncharacterized protein n=1 Tax=Roridomyces roridus TaxID=1738132 RepID=A0AAD7C120_9AGAR|nr:hypothetical protein FB45DRAFT_1055771 [Roridomyces roridus]
MSEEPGSRTYPSSVESQARLHVLRTLRRICREGEILTPSEPICGMSLAVGRRRRLLGRCRCRHGRRHRRRRRWMWSSARTLSQALSCPCGIYHGAQNHGSLFTADLLIHIASDSSHVAPLSATGSCIQVPHPRYKCTTLVYGP